jgi:hypothetical protein
MNDLRFAFRQFLKNPGFTAVATTSFFGEIAPSPSGLFDPLLNAPDGGVAS